MKNKKGLSGIVTTLIIILLVLAAVGLIWTPISNMIGSGTSSLDTAAMCSGVSMNAIRAVSGGADNSLNVTIKRNAGGPDSAAGVLITTFSEADVSTVSKSDLLWEKTGTQVYVIPDAESVLDANKVVVTPYFLDDAGKDIICDLPTEYNFNL